MSPKGFGSNEGLDCSQVIEILGSAKVAVHLPCRSILGAVLASKTGPGILDVLFVRVCADILQVQVRHRESRPPSVVFVLSCGVIVGPSL